MSLKFSIHAQSSLKCSDVDNGTVSYGLPSVLKIEPGRCVVDIKTGVFIHDCDQSGTVLVTPTDAFAESLVFSENSFTPSSTKGVTLSITNKSSTFVRVEPTELLCKYQFVPNPIRSAAARQPARTKSRGQLIVPVKVLQAVAAAAGPVPVQVAQVPVQSESSTVESTAQGRAARRRARKQSVDLVEEVAQVAEAAEAAEPAETQATDEATTEATETVEESATPDQPSETAETDTRNRGKKSKQRITT